MTHATEQMRDILKLTPLTDPPMPFVQFLLELKEHRERADTAPALVLSAILALGEEKVEDEPDHERRLFLQTSKEAGFPSYNAFKHDCGSQRFTGFMLAFLRAAGSNGAQLKKMVIVEGGPGSGKDFWGDGIETALEKGAKIYAVKDCPDHENPINLLKLLNDEQLAKLAEVTGLGDALFDMLKVAGDPCQSCYTRVMGDLASANENPSLEAIEVEAIRLSKRSTGVAEWKPGENCSLVASLRRGNRGVVMLPDAFIKRELKPGEADERLLLLDATQYRRLPGVTDGCGTVSASSPLDTFIMATTNRGALEEFLNTLPDKDAFTGRSTIIKKPYNLVRVEEVRAYLTEMARYKERSTFDPLALKMIATLAVISRYAVPKEGEPFVHPIDRLRLLQGERIQVKPRPASDWTSVWSTGESRSSSGSSYGGGFGGYGSQREEPKPQATGPAAMSIPADAQISSQLMWRLIGKEEGLSGLDMRFMLSLLSSINEFGIKEPHKCVTALEAIMLLRVAIASQLTQSNLTPEQTAYLTRCQKWLGGRPGPNETWTKAATDRPELIEAEYRRLLKQQVIQVFAPDYERQAQELYEKYKLHATALAAGEKTVKDPKLGTIPVKQDVVDDLDRYRLGKGQGGFIRDDERLTGVMLQTAIGDAREKFIMEQLGEGVKPDDADLPQKRLALSAKFKETWETIPELAAAIRAKLDEKVGKRVEKLLTTEVTSDLSEDEQSDLERARKAMFDLGYCEASVKPVLEYAKRTKVWAYKA